MRIDKKDWLEAAVLAALALATRLLFLAGSGDRAWPHSIFFQGDAVLWVNQAAALATGEPFEDGLPLRSPATAYALAAMGVDGESRDFTAVKIIWCAISALGCGLAFLAFRLEFERPTALAAAGLLAFSYGDYLISTSLNVEGLYRPLLPLIIAATLLFARRGNIPLAVLLGVLHGLGCLMRPEHLIFAVGAGLYFIFRAIGRPQIEAWGATPDPCGGGNSQTGKPNPGGRGAAMPRKLSADAGRPWCLVLIRARRTALNVGVLLTAMFLICLPWNLAAWRAVDRYNRETTYRPEQSLSPDRWSPEAIACLNRLPAFARQDNAEYLDHLLGQRPGGWISASDVENAFQEEFGYVPEPISKFFFVTMSGPLNFALANHPRSDGGFTKAALESKYGYATTLNPALPLHLWLINHGHAVGLGAIMSDPGGWLRQVGWKFERFWAGATLGWGAWNLPYGQGGIRRAVDLTTPRSGMARWIQLLWAIPVLIGVGEIVRTGRGGWWLAVLAYKGMVTLLYYGYARQAASIEPVFVLLLVMGTARMVKATTVDRRVSLRALPRLSLAAVVILLLLDVLHVWMAPRFRPIGTAAPAPRWGPEAFVADAEVLILPE